MTATLQDPTDYSAYPPEPALSIEDMLRMAAEAPGKNDEILVEIRTQAVEDPKGYAERLERARANAADRDRATVRTQRFLAAAEAEMVQGQRNDRLLEFAAAALSAQRPYLLDDLAEIAAAAGLPADEIRTVMKQAPRYTYAGGSRWWDSEVWGDGWTSDDRAILDLDDPEHPRNIQARLAEQKAAEPLGRRVRLTCAADIAPMRAKWLWQGRVALGTLSILAGREGVGKSTLAYWTAAQITRGTLPGERFGTPAAVLVAATEDSWAHTIVPRLIAVGADLTRVYRVDVASDSGGTELILPTDLAAVAQAINELGVALLLLDPLMSRLSKSLDTHKDQETRQALEPLVKMLNETQAAAIGLMHFNKRETDDPLNALMASRAFAAVARSVSTVVHDPDDGTRQRRLFGTPKNNLGPDNLPLLAFTLEPFTVPTSEGDAETSRILWHGQVNESISSVMRRANENHVVTAKTSATAWLLDYLTGRGGSEDSAEIKAVSIGLGHSDRTLARARTELRLVVTPVPKSFPRRTTWSLPPLSALAQDVEDWEIQ